MNDGKNIKRFLQTLALALLPAAAVNVLLVGALVLLSAREDLTYVNYASTFDKKHRLDSLPAGRRLVVVGGSNARFGFDCGVLHRLQPKLEPVNMGIHVGLGLQYMLDEVKGKLTKGDVLLLSAEYNHFFSTDLYEGDEGLTDMLLMKHEWGKALAHVVQTQNYFSLYALLRKRIRRSRLAPPDIDPRMEVRTKYNRYGDYVGHYGLPPLRWTVSTLPARPSEAVVTAVAATLHRLQQAGVRVLLVPPPYARSAYRRNEASVTALREALEQHGLHYAVPPCQTAYPDSLYYDSPYHLTRSGVQKHSEAVGRLLLR